MKAKPNSPDCGGPRERSSRPGPHRRWSAALAAALLSAALNFPATAQQLIQRDFGDAPKGYPEASYPIGRPFLGKAIDGESATQSNDTATGDDASFRTEPDDEDGVTIPGTMMAGQSAELLVEATGSGFLHAWIDFNGDLDWDDPGEQIITLRPITEPTTVIGIFIPESAEPGQTFARFRFSSSQETVGPGGHSQEFMGEVEDHSVRIEKTFAFYDFGDANEQYPVLLSQNGAMHAVIEGFYLGKTADTEFNGQPSVNADGDDKNPAGAVSDEDGVRFLSALLPGQTATVEVTLTTQQGGLLDAWIDFSRNGSWGESGEKIFSSRALVNGANTLSFSVPAGTQAGNTYARFRLSFAGTESPTGEASSGEVEDYQVQIQEDQLDFGDAPPAYPVTLSQNGARHRYSRSVSLGTAIDAEQDGQPSATAAGDDSQPAGASDDEDGVSFAGPLETGATATVQVTASVAQHRLDAWIDFNGNGSWNETGEKIANSVVLNSGVNTLTFTVPSAAALGQTAARFRLSLQGGLAPTGGASEGEVEDYMVTIQQQALDFGDAPQNFPVALSQDGARHTYQRDFHLGPRADIEPDGQPSSNANADDLNPSTADDEDGVIFGGGLVPAQPHQLQVTASTGQGRLDAWVDFNRDGDWADEGEKIYNAQVLNSGPNNLSFNVPAGAVPGPTFARFRFSAQGGLDFTGFGGIGEVEDHTVQIEQTELDFGDAPESFPVTLSQDGARHRVVKGINLGRHIDSEQDGQPSGSASADDSNPVGGLGDEDGIRFLTSVIPGQNATVEVTSTTGQARLDAWIDYNGDGDWNDSGEQIFSSQLLNAGPQNLFFPVLASAKAGATFARFRMSLRGGLKPNGSAPEGEVEDYLIRVSQELLDFGDAIEAFPVVLAQDGARHRIQQGFHLGRLIDGEPDGQPTATSLGDDLNPFTTAASLDDEDGVRFLGLVEPGRNASVEVVASSTGLLDAWVDFNRNGNWNDPGEQIFISRPLPTGTNVILFPVPASAAPGDSYSRFRFSRQGGLKPFGHGGDGEVEDHRVTIVEPRGDCDPRTHRGTDFWVTFPGNYAPDPDNQVRLRLYIVGQRETTGTVTIPGLGFSTNWIIPASREKIIDLPRDAELGNANDLVQEKGINITANREVAVYGMNRVRWTTDGYLALPTDVIGRNYVLQGYGNEFTGVPDLNGTQFGLVATEDGTVVTITPKVATGTHPAGVAYNINLNRGDTYQLRNTNDFNNDLTGSVVSANKAIAVFGSHQCSTVPNDDLWFCDHLVEQILPLERAGTSFFAAPLATRSAEAYRITAAYDNTTVHLNGVNIGTINSGQFIERVTAGPVRVLTTKPAFLTQYSPSSDYDGVVNSDPFMIVITPVSMWLNQYLFTAPNMEFADHYVGMVVPNAVVGGLMLDGAAVPAAQFAAIPASAYSYARLKVSPGVHEMFASATFGIVVYGWAEYDSYGFPGGMFFGDSQPPELTCPEKITVTVGGPNVTGAAACVAQVPDLRQQVTAKDNCGMPERVIITQTPPPGTAVGPGIHIITLSTQDAEGNEGFCLVEFEVIDPSPLQLLCPQNMLVTCNTNGGAHVNYEAIARRACGPVDLPITYSPPSGGFFKDGTTTTVTASVVDPSKNETVTCTFQVTVRCGSTPNNTISVIKNALNNSFTLSWGADAVLEQSTNLRDWSAVTSADGSYTVVPTGEKSFYRLRILAQ